jgi:hypothetical protein
MKILAIDPALKRNGFCLVEETETGENYVSGFGDIGGLAPAIRDLGAHFLVIEDQFNMRLKEVIGFYRGVAYCSGYRGTIKIQARTWKNWLDPQFPRMKKSSKKDVAFYLSEMQRHTGILFDTTDEADAYCMAKFVMSLRGYSGKQPTYKRIAKELEAV